MAEVVSGAGNVLRDVAQTAFRLFPWPTETGLRKVGRPDAWSPVLVTGNYDLTVRRLERALRGLDAWLVVAPSSGINVWCAAAGGHFTTHHVVTALKTSGVDRVVRHRNAILPQLAATGVIAREVNHRCGWRVRFGPVYAKDLPRFLAAAQKKSEDMRRVRFGPAERLEMAAAWAGPTALVLGAVALFLRPDWALPLVTWCGLLAVAVFLIYDRIPGPRRILFGSTAAALAALLALAVGAAPSSLTAAALTSLLLTGILTFDYPGSTPIEGGSHFEERQWRIALDEERCRGVWSCWEVCPEAVFDKRRDVRKTVIARPDACMRCGACIVQCPLDALHFETDDGRRVSPESIRRFKLNLLGKRVVKPAD